MTTQLLEWQRWRDERLQALVGVPGNLALVAYQGVGVDDESVEFMPGITARREGDDQGVIINAAADVGALIDGVAVPGEAFLARLRPEGTPLLRVGRYWADAFSLDGADFELRIYDEQADNLDNFAGIDCYDYDPRLVVPGRFAQFESTSKVAWAFTRSTDTGHTKQVPGELVVTLDGTDYALQAFLDGPALVLVFADATTGAESYAPGRFLRMPRPANDEAIDVDFNRTFIPPCGFSDFYSCPIPPATNRLPLPIRAGEKRVVWKRPRY